MKRKVEMANLINVFRERFRPITSLPAGVHHFQSPADEVHPYRLHLRLEADGSGVLIVNARTILHLNTTAAEYAFHWIQGATPEQAARAVAARYRVHRRQALRDFQEFMDAVCHLAVAQDVDPETYLGVERQDPYAGDLSAPYRLDCALTYRLPEGESGHYAPIERVKAELSTEEWKIILDKAWTAGIPHVLFTGGEPVLRDDLTALIAHAEKNGQVSGLISGSERIAEKEFLDSLLRSGLDHLMLLLRPDADISWQALQNALEANLFTTVHISLDQTLVSQLRPLLERVKKNEVRYISLSSCDAAGRIALGKAIDIAAELGLPLTWDLPVPYSAFHPASQEESGPVSSGAGKSWLYLEPDGDVLPEQGVNKVLGNMLQETWSDIWGRAQGDLNQD
jgi:hypothetical protein